MTTETLELPMESAAAERRRDHLTILLQTLFAGRNHGALPTGFASYIAQRSGVIGIGSFEDLIDAWSTLKPSRRGTIEDGLNKAILEQKEAGQTTYGISTIARRKIGLCFEW